MSETHSKSFKVWIVTVSDTRSSGENVDTVGPMIAKMLQAERFEIGGTYIVPDERERIAEILKKIVDDEKADLIITTGGTGLSPRDVTPEATREVIEREAPGLAEWIRYSGATQTIYSWLSRGVAGLRGSCLIINIPGSERAAVESIQALIPILKHAIEIERNESHECGRKMEEEQSLNIHLENPPMEMQKKLEEFFDELDVQIKWAESVRDSDLCIKWLDGVETCIPGCLYANGRISCNEAFIVAQRSRVGHRDFGKLLNFLNIKIYGCQLGCFK